MTTRRRCSTCNRILVWSNGRLLCANAQCPGHDPGRDFADLRDSLDDAA